MKGVNNMHMLNQTAQNFYNPKNENDSFDMANQQRNYSTGMKNQ